MTDNIINFKKTKSEKENKQVNVIGFVQDNYVTEDDFKCPLPEDYLSESNIPFHVMEEMKDKKNSWCDMSGNIHFSKDYIPEPYVGNDNEVYLHLGDLTMKNEEVVSGLMLKGIQLLKKVS